MKDSDREYEEAREFLENYEGTPLGHEFRFPVPMKLVAFAAISLIVVTTGAALFFYWFPGQP